MELEENNNLLTIDPSGIDISGNKKLILDSNGHIFASDISINSLELNEVVFPNPKNANDNQILVKSGNQIIWKDNKAEELGIHQTDFVVKIGKKTSNHPYYGIGSEYAFYIDDVESPILYFKCNHTYNFLQTDITNRTFPIVFFNNIGGRTVNYQNNGIPGFTGAYTQIQITEDTPTKIYYDVNVTNTEQRLGNYCSVELSIEHVSTNELKYLNGVTSNIQQQLINAASTSSGSSVVANNGSGNAEPLTKIEIDGISYPISGGGGSSQWTNGNNNSIFYNSGNIGIGTDAPTKTLDISGGLNVSNGSIITDGIRLRGSNMTTVSNTLRWDSSGNKIFYNTDNVGIGVNDPSEKLEVNGTIKASNMKINNVDVATKSYVNLELLTKQNIINQEISIFHKLTI